MIRWPMLRFVYHVVISKDDDLTVFSQLSGLEWLHITKVVDNSQAMY